MTTRQSSILTTQAMFSYADVVVIRHKSLQREYWKLKSFQIVWNDNSITDMCIIVTRMRPFLAASYSLDAASSILRPNSYWQIDDHNHSLFIRYQGYYLTAHRLTGGYKLRMNQSLSVRPSVCLSVRPSVCLSVRLSVRSSGGGPLPLHETK